MSRKTIPAVEKRFCDREGCGVEIKLAAGTHFALVTVESEGWDAMGNGAGGRVKYDLCGNCVDALWRLIEGGVVITHEQYVERFEEK